MRSRRRFDSSSIRLHHFWRFFFSNVKKIFFFQKLAGLWLVGEVVNHVGLYGSKVAEGCSAFQRRSCFDLVKQAKFATSGHFLENAREEWPELWHANVSWPSPELIKFWSWSVDFPFLASFWLSETGQIWGLWQFSSECMGGMACNLICWCILTTFATAYILVWWFSSFWQEFDLVKQVIFAIFRHFLENAKEELAELILWYSNKWKRQISAY